MVIKMKARHMDKFIDHLNYYFEQEDPGVYHRDGMKPHIDILRYPPNDKYPFWKLVTMGASDCKLSKKGTIGRFNEYMLFVDEQVRTTELNWYLDLLVMIALFPFDTGESISYRHSLEFPADENEEMKGVVILLPQVIKNTGILHCKLGFKDVVCLQVMPITESEMKEKLMHGTKVLEDKFYPENGEYHFLAEQKRSFR